MLLSGQHAQKASREYDSVRFLAAGNKIAGAALTGSACSSEPMNLEPFCDFDELKVRRLGTGREQVGD